MHQNCPGVSRIAVIAVALLFSAVVANADTSAPPFGERPGAGGPPDEVTVVLGLVDIDAIHDREQRFGIDAYIEFRWMDPRLAIHVDESTDQADRVLPISEIWNPRLTIVNDRGLSATLQQLADVDASGNVVVRQRIAGQLAVDLDLHKFPFDKQVLALEIVSSRYSAEDIVFTADSYMIDRTDQFSAKGWRYQALAPVHGSYALVETMADSPLLRFSVRAERDPSFYVLTLALPMLLILSMSWMAHWLPTDVAQQRLSMSTATVFSLITLGLGFRLTLPKVSYLTRADLFIIYSSILILLSLSAIVASARWVRLDRAEDADRLSGFVLRAFPVALLIVGALALIG
ncbi:MAG: hypothetical protein QNJ00_04435 [Woeseiaceae bacterium]|nr:hypothetical protein [Woeseiaceae bacterium]